MNVIFCQTFASFLFSSERRGKKIQTASAALSPVPTPLLECGLTKLLLFSPCWPGKGSAGTTPCKHQKYESNSKLASDPASIGAQTALNCDFHIGNIEI